MTGWEKTLCDAYHRIERLEPYNTERESTAQSGYRPRRAPRDDLQLDIDAYDSRQNQDWGE